MVNDPNWQLPNVPEFQLSSPEVRPGEYLPVWARAKGAGGEDRSPTLSWTGAPEGTKSFVLTMYDPDAPTGSGYWHWAVHDIPGSITALPADAGNPESGLMPPGAKTIANEIRQERFQGAAPPAGHGDHRYFFTVSALNISKLDLPTGCTPAVMGFIMRTAVIGRAQFFALSVTPAES
ncbi:MAG: YbhB/YbcL family Raf kinase inhibitor-like protein [Microbacteriaceae bacterium]|nr:YbhB/YbcL family Raf kinase inhibitor-like protein [Microbacteriaceae bacterium]